MKQVSYVRWCAIASRWDFLAPLRGVGHCWRHLRGCFEHSAAQGWGASTASSEPENLRGFGSPSEPTVLPWSKNRPPLVRFITVERCFVQAQNGSAVWRPSSDMPTKRPLPRRIATSLRGRDPSRYLRSILVVLHHLDGFRRFAGRRLIASYCQTWGSPRFCLCRPTAPCPKTGMNRCKHRIRAKREHPRDANHTLRRIPLLNSRIASLQPLPACRFDGFQALLRSKVRDVVPSLRTVDTLSFHGLRSPSRSSLLGCGSCVRIRRFRWRQAVGEKLRSTPQKAASR